MFPSNVGRSLGDICLSLVNHSPQRNNVSIVPFPAKLEKTQISFCSALRKYNGGKMRVNLQRSAAAAYICPVLSRDVYGWLCVGG